MNPRADRPVPVEVPVTGVAYDSRRTGPGNVFVCVRGERSDGHEHAAGAVRAGAVCLVGEREALPPMPGREWGTGPHDAPPYVRVDDARKALALLSCAYFRHPSRDLLLAGVTGTNGKTSVTWMCDAVFREAGLRSAVLGTLGGGIPGALRASAHTTPEAPELQAELAGWRDDGIEAGAMEVSSHGLALRRSYGTRFACVVFTNLSPDHLDFHGTMDAYREAKALLFRSEERGPDEPPAIAVVNAEDPATPALLAGTGDAVITFGATPRGERGGPLPDIRPVVLRTGPDGIRMRVAFRIPGPGDAAGEADVVSPLIGSFQVDNLLAAFGAGLALGLDPDRIGRGLGRLRTVPGRMESADLGGDVRVLVDYAHTPDALRRALESLRPFTQGRILLVFGCGGDRDSAKRAPMGEAAARGADWIVITDDNPRTEDPAAIRAQARAGLERAGARFIDEPDRELAIRAAVEEARPGDIVLIAGKGHETMQIRGTERIPFDDRQVVRGILAGRNAR